MIGVHLVRTEGADRLLLGWFPIPLILLGNGRAATLGAHPAPVRSGVHYGDAYIKARHCTPGNVFGRCVTLGFEARFT